MLRSFKEIKEPIKNVLSSKDDDGFITNIKLVYSNFQLELVPEADCCSISWFIEKTDLKVLIGKEIDFIDEDTKSEINLPDSNIQEVDKHYLYKFYFKNSLDEFDIYLTNSSNGYYDGWLSVKLVK